MQWKPLSNTTPAFTRIARRGFDDDVTGFDASGFLGVFNHLQPDAILDAATGVEELALGVERAAGAASDGLQAHHRRVADGIEDRILDVSHGSLRCRIAARRNGKLSS